MASVVDDILATKPRSYTFRPDDPNDVSVPNQVKAKSVVDDILATQPRDTVSKILSTEPKKSFWERNTMPSQHEGLGPMGPGDVLFGPEKEKHWASPGGRFTENYMLPAMVDIAALTTVAGALPTVVGPLARAAKSAVTFGTVNVGKQAAEAISGKEEIGGSPEAAKNMLFGAALSLGVDAFGAGLRKLLPTGRMKVAKELGLPKKASDQQIQRALKNKAKRMVGLPNTASNEEALTAWGNYIKEGLQKEYGPTGQRVSGELGKRLGQIQELGNLKGRASLKDIVYNTKAPTNIYTPSAPSSPIAQLPAGAASLSTPEGIMKSTTDRLSVVESRPGPTTQMQRKAIIAEGMKSLDNAAVTAPKDLLPDVRPDELAVPTEAPQKQGGEVTQPWEMTRDEFDALAAKGNPRASIVEQPLENVANGTKPVSSIDDADVAKAKELGLEVHEIEGVLYATRPGDKALAQKASDIMGERKGAKDPLFHFRAGRAFGYPDADIAAFVKESLGEPAYDLMVAEATRDAALAAEGGEVTPQAKLEQALNEGLASAEDTGAIEAIGKRSTEASPTVLKQGKERIPPTTDIQVPPKGPINVMGPPIDGEVASIVPYKGAGKPRKYRKPTARAQVTDPVYYGYKLGVGDIIEKGARAHEVLNLEAASEGKVLDQQLKKLYKLEGVTRRERVKSAVLNVPTKADMKWADLFDKNEEAPPNLNVPETQLFNYFRRISRLCWQWSNEARSRVGMPLIDYRENYFRRVVIPHVKEGLRDGTWKIPEHLRYWKGKKLDPTLFNSAAFKRESEEFIESLFSRDVGFSMRSMLWASMREKHLLEPLKFCKDQMTELSLDPDNPIPAETRQWAEDYFRVMLKGEQTGTDKRLNDMATQGTPKVMLNAFLKPFGRAVGARPISHAAATSSRMAHMGTMGLRPKQDFRNLLQFTHDFAFDGIGPTMRASLPETQEEKEWLDQSLYLQNYTGVEPEGMVNKFGRAKMADYIWTARRRARKSMRSARFAMNKYFFNPGKAKYGWASPKRTGNEPSGFLYPDEKKLLMNEAEWRANAGQFAYTTSRMPGVYQNKTMAGATTFSSWWMNYYSKFMPEMAFRARYGRPGWAGTEGPPMLDWSDRMGFLKYIVLGGLIHNTAMTERSYLFGAAPSGIPPAASLAWGMFQYTVGLGQGNDELKKAGAKRMSNAAKTFIPGYMTYRDWNAYKKSGDITDLLFYKKK